MFGVLLLVLIFPIREQLLHLTGSEFPSPSEILWPWLVVGLLGVVTASVLTNLEPKARKIKDGIFGLTSFVVSLWILGAVIYFRDDWAWWLERLSALETSTLEYYGFLGVSTTVFALLMAFEVARLEQRSSSEQELVFWLLSRFYQLDDKHVDNPPESLQSKLEALDKVKETTELEGRYTSIRKQLLDSGQSPDAEVFTKLNLLVYSKQSGVAVSSRIAIALLAFFSIALSLVLRPPDTEGLEAILIESFALILSAVMAYLTFHLFDLRNARARSSVEKDSLPLGRGYVPEFVPAVSRQSESVSIALIAIIIITYISLYSVKWLV